MPLIQQKRMGNTTTLGNMILKVENTERNK